MNRSKTPINTHKLKLVNNNFGNTVIIIIIIIIIIITDLYSAFRSEDTQALGRYRGALLCLTEI